MVIRGSFSSLIALFTLRSEVDLEETGKVPGKKGDNGELDLGG